MEGRRAFCTSTTVFGPDLGSAVAAYDNLHSRVVGWAKLVLPLIALGLLSTLFLFARTANDPGDIPFAEIGELAREQQITAPTFSGITNDGSSITITADTALPEAGSLATLSVAQPKLTMNAIDGTNLKIVAGEGAIDNAEKEARLSGLARLETSSGYLMETKELIADLGTGTINSLGPLAVMAPFGEITAGLVRIELGKDNSGQQMHFTNGVNMIYDPQKADR